MNKQTMPYPGKPYYFKEGNATLWLTAGEYTRLHAAFLVAIEEGRTDASRLEGFGPAPVN